jgi:glycerophosphoryl diester phosphodiesterase
MPTRPAVVTTTGVLLGMSALALTTAPAHAAPTEDSESRPPVTVAHRGASGYAPENTLAAVDKADKLGIDWVETDVQRTKDNKLVVMHDTSLERTTNAEKVYPDRAPWGVSDFTLKEIKRLDAGRWFSEDYTGEKVPTLKQWLGRVSKNHQHQLLELKSPELYPGITTQTLGELRADGWLDEKHLRKELIVQSFNADAVRAVHLENPDVRTGFLGNPKPSELESYASFSDQINPPYAKVSKDYVKAVHSLKGPSGKPMQVFTWTVNDADTAKKVDAAGVDGIISNYPDVVQKQTHG